VTYSRSLRKAFAPDLHHWVLYRPELSWNEATDGNREVVDYRLFILQRTSFVIIRSWVRLPSPAPRIMGSGLAF
jgi:hypothetical protein